MSVPERICVTCHVNLVLSTRKFPRCRPCEVKRRAVMRDELKAKRIARCRSKAQRTKYKSKVEWRVRTTFINKALVTKRTTTDIVQDLILLYPEEDMKRLRNFVYVQRLRARKRMDNSPREESIVLPEPVIPEQQTDLFADNPMELAEEFVVDGVGEN